MLYIIDDDASIRKSMARLMLSAGVEAQIFESAESFLEAVRPTSSDCLLLDIQLPGLNGLELQQQLRESGMDAKVIFITAFDDDELRKKAGRAGAVGYFRKPFDDQALLDTISFNMVQSDS